MAHLEMNVSSSVCRKCGNAYGRQKGYFPTSYGFLYKGTGYLPYCKTCVDSMYDSYFAICKDARKAARQMCRKLDLYWNESIFDYVERKNTNRTIMTAYIVRANTSQYVGKCYDDTLMEEGNLWSDLDLPPKINIQNQVIQNNDKQMDSDSVEVDPDIVEFWGADFAPEFLLRLDKRYKKWTNGQDDLDQGAVSLFKHICILEETIAMDSAAGRSVDKNMNTLNTLLGSLNLKPVQKKTEMDAAIEGTPFGVWIDRWEHKRPIPEPDPMLKDVDGIVKYITVWFYGHIAKTLGIPNVYCEMYEKEMEKMKVDRPEAFDEDVDDDESIFNSIFGDKEV